MRTSLLATIGQSPTQFGLFDSIEEPKAMSLRRSRSSRRRSCWLASSPAPNGLRLSGARLTPPSENVSPRAVCGGTAARVRCSHGLGDIELAAAKGLGLLVVDWLNTELLESRQVVLHGLKHFG